MATSPSIIVSRSEAARPAEAAGGLDRGAIKDLVVEKLAQVDATDVAAIKQALEEGGGNIAVDSQQAVTIIAMLGQHFGRTLPGPEDLRPREYTSVESLTSLVAHSLCSTSPGER